MNFYGLMRFLCATVPAITGGIEGSRSGTMAGMTGVLIGLIMGCVNILIITFAAKLTNPPHLIGKEQPDAYSLIADVMPTALLFWLVFSAIAACSITHYSIFGTFALLDGSSSVSAPLALIDLAPSAEFLGGITWMPR